MMNDADFLMTQVVHWINTPANGYLGSDYGVDLPIMLQQPMQEFDADALIAKMYRDIPALQLLGRDAVNVYAADQGIDSKTIYLQIADKVYDLNTLIGAA